MRLTKIQIKQIATAMERENVETVEVLDLGDGKITLQAVEVKEVTRALPLTKRAKNGNDVH